MQETKNICSKNYDIYGYFLHGISKCHAINCDEVRRKLISVQLGGRGGVAEFLVSWGDI